MPAGLLLSEHVTVYLGFFQFPSSAKHIRRTLHGAVYRIAFKKHFKYPRCFSSSLRQLLAFRLSHLPELHWPQPCCVMAGDSSSGAKSAFYPVSAHEAFHQPSTNLSRLSDVGTSVWQSTQSYLNPQKSPYQQRNSVLRRKILKSRPLLGSRRRALRLSLPETGIGDDPSNIKQITIQQINSGLCTRLSMK